VCHRPADDDLFLVGTSEVPLAGYHADEIIDLVLGAEAVRGLVVLLPARGRVVRQGNQGHHPVHSEQDRDVHLRPAEDATAEHARLLGWGEEMLAKFEVPTGDRHGGGDLGASAARKFDCEAMGADAAGVPRAHPRPRLAPRSRRAG